MPVTATTELPDEDQPVLGNGVEDEVAIDRETQRTDYGDIRLQIRETGQSAWGGTATGFAELVIDHAATTTQFTNREDGEEYEVRARSETEHVTGAWTTPTAITTKFPGAAALSIDTITTTSADLSWTDQSDNEDGFTVERAKEYDSGWGPWRDLATLAPNTTAYTDGTVQPNRTYRYRVRAFTEDAEAYSSTVSSASGSTNVRQQTVPASGWYVEVEHPNVDEPLRPRILDDPQWLPTINGRPQCRVPIPLDESWDSPNLEEADMRVWQDGTELEVDTLADVELQPDRTVLIGEGASELDQRVQAEYSNKEAHVALEELIEDNTSYTADVDDPGQGATETLMQSVSSSADFSAALEAQPSASDPWAVADGQLVRYQTAWATDSEDFTVSGSNLIQGGQYTGGVAEEIDANGAAVEIQFTTAHEIPASDLEVWIRFVTQGSGNGPGLELTLNGHTWQPLSDGAGFADLAWRDLATNSYGTPDTYAGGDLPAGDHTLRIEGTTSGDGQVIDVGAPLDGGGRFGGFTNTFDNDNGGSGGYLAGPQDFSAAIDVPFAAVATPQSVVGGRVEASVTSTAGQQALELSNDGGQNWSTGANTESFETTFASGGGSLQFRVTLGRYGSRTGQTPTTGFNGGALDSFSTYADVEDTPILVDKVYDNDLATVFSLICDFGYLNWEARRVNGETTISVTRPGQREADIDPAIVGGQDAYTVTKSTKTYQKITIKGAARRQSNEPFTSNHGTAVSLTQQEMVEGKAAVYDPATGENFEEGTDYEIDYSAGEITTLSSGSMSDQTEYAIDYSRKPVGSAETGDYTAGDRELVRTITTASSNRECEQAALYLLKRLSTPRYGASVTLDRVEAGRSLLDDLDIEGLPGDTRFVTDSIDMGPRTATVELENRQRIGSLLERVEQRLAATERVA